MNKSMRWAVTNQLPVMMPQVFVNGVKLCDEDTDLGLDRGAAIPIHVFVDPQQRVRCVRVGAVSEPDYKTVEHLLQGG